jgi:hypothetical protein
MDTGSITVYLCQGAREGAEHVGCDGRGRVVIEVAMPHVILFYLY